MLHPTYNFSHSYSNLVLALGSVTGYHHLEGAKEYAFPFWTQADAIALDRHLSDCLQRAVQTEDAEQRLQLLTVVIVGGGASGVEMAATLADLLPHWYTALGGNSSEIRVVVLNHGKEILNGDINDPLRPTAEWLDEQIFRHHLDAHDVGKKVVQAVEVVGGGVVAALVARKLLKMLGNEEKKN